MTDGATRALAALHVRGAHFVLAGTDKRPLAREWQKTPPDFAAVRAHAEVGGLVGVIPASVGCFVVDVDDGGAHGVEALQDTLGVPITVTETRREGGYHAWYRAPDDKVGNRQWRLNGACGDIRGSTGFAVLWDPGKLAEGLSLYFDDAVPADPSKLPRSRMNRAHGPEAVRTAPNGARNETLNREAFLAAKRGEDLSPYRDAALLSGISAHEIEATLASAVRAGTEQAPNIVPPPSSPMAVARDLATALYTTSAQTWTLRVHRGDFYGWNGRHWPEIDVRDIRGAVYRWLEHAYFNHPDKGELRPFNPTKRKIDDVIDALKAVVLLDSDASPPCWMSETVGAPATEMVSMTNGLLHVPTRTMRPHTPDLFCHHSLEFAYEPECDPPVRWLAFLHELWSDASSIDALQEMMGYILGGDTRQQKMFLVIGPKRAGKGTIARVLTGLLGAHNVAAPTLASLSTNFGLSPLIGKPLGLISDARLSGRSDGNIVVERLLSVSGEDSLTIDRKYREPWTGRLPTRFVVMTNELPRLTDSSGALASRFIVFVLTKSFYGRENCELTNELLSEAPAIFNWALEGLNRLNARGFSVCPESGKAAIQDLEDLSSPISAFVRDVCVVGSEYRVEVNALWSAWKTWCENDNRNPGTKAVFGRDLHAAVPIVRKIRPIEGGSRTHAYEGIELRSV